MIVGVDVKCVRLSCQIQTGLSREEEQAKSRNREIAVVKIKIII
jgi:hypothetical protein